ncbi:hypothetical protein CMI37_38595 [Candidatus Pacearchaeota archaeon]|nr:hypothetical protein [Candidatus Pacearchaeota archaeon]
MHDSYLTSRDGICTMQTIVSYSGNGYTQEALDGWAAEARQALDCQHVMGGSMGEPPRTLYQVQDAQDAQDAQDETEEEKS